MKHNKGESFRFSGAARTLLRQTQDASPSLCRLPRRLFPLFGAAAPPLPLGLRCRALVAVSRHGVGSSSLSGGSVRGSEMPDDIGTAKPGKTWHFSAGHFVSKTGETFSRFSIRICFVYNIDIINTTTFMWKISVIFCGVLGGSCFFFFFCVKCCGLVASLTQCSCSKDTTTLLHFPARLTWTPQPSHVLRFPERRSDWLRGVPLCQKSSALIGWAGAPDVEHCIIRPCAPRFRRVVHVRQWPRFPGSRVASPQTSWQVHVWVGREREQSWSGLGNRCSGLQNKFFHETKDKQTFYFVIVNLNPK